MHKNQHENFAPEKQQKRGKRTRFSQKKAKPGAFWVLEGMGTGANRCERMGKPGVRTKTNPIPMQHMQKENRQKPRVSAGFVAGAEGLEPSARGFGVDVETRKRERGRGSAARFSQRTPRRTVLVWCCVDPVKKEFGNG